MTFRRIVTSILIVSGVLIGLGAVLARGPDFEVRFERVVPTDLSPETLDRAFFAMSNWPKWHHMTKDVKMVDVTGMEYPLKEQSLLKGALLRFVLVPGEKAWKKFELHAEVTDYIPKQRLAIRVLGDSKGQLDQAFQSLEWTIDLETPAPGKTIIHGSALARTRSWRSRLFGRISPRILMNQVFYPDLLSLAALKDPLPVVPTRVPDM